MIDIDKDFAQVVREEVSELLEDLEATLLELESAPQDQSLVGKVFRVMHTIKGSAGMAGFDQISDFTHHVETILDKVRNGVVPVSRELINLTLASRDHINKMLAAACGDGEYEPETGEEILTSLKGLVEVFKKPRKKKAVEKTETPAPEEESTPDEPGAEEIDQPEDEPPPDHFLLHMELLPSFFENKLDLDDLLENLGCLGEMTVSPEAPAEDEATHIRDILLTTGAGEDGIRDILIFFENDITYTITDLGGGTADALPEHRRLGEILIERGDLAADDLKKILDTQKPIGQLLVESEVVSEAKVNSALAAQKLIDQKRSAAAGGAGENIKVSSDRLDKQVNLIGELVVIQSRMNQLATDMKQPDLTRASKILERLTGEIRDNVLEMRMLPIGTTFSKFKRLVRDLAGELNKEVEMITEGADTELDKSVIDQLGEPLVHLIRNSIDHGIESPESRTASGKSSTGYVKLAAFHSGANVVIVVSDDGRGLDPDKIREKAVSRGLITPEADLSPAELFKLVFAPGMSTADQVTSVSGRGVGMDVVKSTIESKLKGTVEVTSTPGAGTTITISLPLTLAIIDGLLVRAGATHYVLPLAQVEKCVELSKQDIEQFHGRHVFPFHEQLVPYVRLREFFQVSGPRPDLEQIVVVNLNGERFGLALDEVIGGHQTVIKSLGWVYRNAEGVSGATILGNGEVALIVDVIHLLHLAKSEE